MRSAGAPRGRSARGQGQGREEKLAKAVGTNTGDVGRRRYRHLGMQCEIDDPSVGFPLIARKNRTENPLSFSAAF